MTDLLRSATARQVAAAQARDAAAFQVACVKYVTLAWRAPHPGIPVRAAELSDRLLGSLLLLGRGPAVAAARRAAARRQIEGGETVLSDIPESEWRIYELGLLAELRLLAREWRGLPNMPTRTDLRVLGREAGLRLRHAHALLASFGGRDATAAGKAIAVLARDDKTVRFSVLAYALYREARGLGLNLKVPHKYDF